MARKETYEATTLLLEQLDIIARQGRSRYEADVSLLRMVSEEEARNFISEVLSGEWSERLLALKNTLWAASERERKAYLGY